MVMPNEHDRKLGEPFSIGENAPERYPAVSPVGTTMPRHLAAILDYVISAILGVLVAKQFPDDWLVVQAICLVTVHLVYFLVCEIIFSATPGKLLMGLKILAYNGNRCSPKQALIRILFRLIEVNPLLLGALPAAARIIATRDKQRFGDKVADTIVVFR
jgi:uncharacterized RDD family membrane protein YckC